MVYYIKKIRLTSGRKLSFFANLHRIYLQIEFCAAELRFMPKDQACKVGNPQTYNQVHFSTFSQHIKQRSFLQSATQTLRLLVLSNSWLMVH